MTDPGRIPPPERATLADETNELLSLAVAPSGETAATIEVLAHNPKLVGPFLGWAAALHLDGVLSPRHHEVLALRVAHNCGSTYEWHEHRGWAHQAGLTDDEIGRVATRSSDWPDIEAALIRAADELHTTQDLSDQTLATLTEALGAPAVVEAIMVVGQYTMLSMLATATGVVGPGTELA